MASATAATEDKRELSRLRYEVESYSTSIHDDEARFTVRRNGKAFYIRVSPPQFVNSPATTEKYLSYLEVLKSGEEVINDIFDTDVLEWATQPFEPFFAELAPSPVPPECYKDIRVTLWESLDPDVIVLALDAVDEELRPRQVETEHSPFRPPGAWVESDLLDDVETWTTIYDPSKVILSFDNPEDALFKPPRKVLIDDGQTECFFKPCDSTVQTTNELNAYKKITAAGLGPQLHICRLYGVVYDHGLVVGLLLTYIDHGGCPMSSRVDPDYPPAPVKRRWASQIDTALAELHKAGIVWGDVKAENVLIDQDDNAWITDFGGGYTRGWVSEKTAGTVEGDLEGMAKLRQYIFQVEGQDRWWTG
ncbi:hypothetical protein GGS23DRAFT_556699 [Durotheca rogersii]|uniref:uncharacterized protein n=1 Tax=Durotheca rogersii TaxID=419775 RepID=UPI00221FB387|nr:uncharacterized protein GGS23DRAFT_556699 [Durotheca rogersii]KAI5866347.1 hypothetical protein GGS23DRAFT_556699 [Durotheca rogersii]